MKRITRAAIIVTPLCDFYFTRHRFSCLGAHIVQKLLERRGTMTAFFNFPLMQKRAASLPLPSALSYLRPFLVENETGPVSFFTRFRRFGPDISCCSRMIAQTRPDICMLSVFAFAYADTALELACAIRKILPDVPIVWGGGGPSCFPGYFLRDQGDYVLAGEAEVSLLLFLREMEKPQPDLSRVPNLFWKENGHTRRSRISRITKSSEIEPAIKKTAESSNLVTFSTFLSRGCPKKCDFCSSGLALGKPLRIPSPEKANALFSSIENYENFPKKQLVINIEDDNPLADEAFFRSIITSIKKRFPACELVMENGIDYRFLTPEKTEWLIKNGMKKFNISLGSLDPDILKCSNRACSLEQYETILGVLEKHTIPSITYFICGYKEEKTDTIAQTLRFLARKRTTVGMSPFYAVPGIKGYADYAIFKNKPSCLCLGVSCYPWNESLSTETIVTAFRLARYINLTKNSNRSIIQDQLIEKISDTKSLHTLVKEPASKKVRIVEMESQDRALIAHFFRGLHADLP